MHRKKIKGGGVLALPCPVPEKSETCKKLWLVKLLLNQKCSKSWIQLNFLNRINSCAERRGLKLTLIRISMKLGFISSIFLHVSSQNRFESTLLSQLAKIVPLDLDSILKKIFSEKFTLRWNFKQF